MLPTEKNQDAGLVVELVGQGFYDFWFADTLDEAGLARILGERRGFRELDAYLSSLPRPEILSRQEEKGWLQMCIRDRSTVSHFRLYLLILPYKLIL